MASQQPGLTACKSSGNCIFIQKEFSDAESNFKLLKEIVLKLPRTTVLEDSSNYWKGICRSFVFRFPDELEMLKVNKTVIQIKSSSRFGASDIGVNQRRVRYLLNELDKLKI